MLENSVLGIVCNMVICTMQNGAYFCNYTRVMVRWGLVMAHGVVDAGWCSPSMTGPPGPGFHNSGTWAVTYNWIWMNFFKWVIGRRTIRIEISAARWVEQPTLRKLQRMMMNQILMKMLQILMKRQRQCWDQPELWQQHQRWEVVAELSLFWQPHWCSVVLTEQVPPTDTYKLTPEILESVSY